MSKDYNKEIVQLIYKCDECNNIFHQGQVDKSNTCPECGSKNYILKKYQVVEN